ncbi:hypothetical protein COLO4_33028 [Corchorus olitorius]|uniref:Transmembrane protein n=1 Tax=Corchorus olitorius TaxID=93759 RepID=A0A1R3GWQ9_9ROSI|nr:hypothetical protein COLO4_33028 [Corchorus olitorius]
MSVLRVAPPYGTNTSRIAPYHHRVPSVPVRMPVLRVAPPYGTDTRGIAPYHHRVPGVPVLRGRRWLCSREISHITFHYPDGRQDSYFVKEVEKEESLVKVDSNIDAFESVASSSAHSVGNKYLGSVFAVGVAVTFVQRFGPPGFIKNLGLKNSILVGALLMMVGASVMYVVRKKTADCRGRKQQLVLYKPGDNELNKVDKFCKP